MKHNLSIYLILFLANTNLLVSSEQISEDKKTVLAKKIQSNMGWFPFLSYGKPEIETIKKSLSTEDGAQLLERAIRSRLDFLMFGIIYNGERNQNLIIDPKEINVGYAMALHTLSRHFQEFIVLFLLCYKYIKPVRNGVQKLCATGHRLLNIE